MSQNTPKIYSVGGVCITAFSSFKQAEQHIIDENGVVVSGYANSLNAEAIVMAQDSSEMMQILTDATFNFADGVGVTLAVKRKFGQSIPKLPGCELWEKLMIRAAQFSIPVFVLGATADVNKQTVEKLNQIGVRVVGAQDGYFQDEDTLLEEIKRSEAKIVSVAMGMPRQEYFISRARKVLPLCFFMGVGGTFDVFTGNVKRAPQIFCKIGLEWLYRLLSQPTRIGRQLKLVTFVWLLCRGKL